MMIPSYINSIIKLNTIKGIRKVTKATIKERENKNIFEINKEILDKLIYNVKKFVENPEIEEIELSEEIFREISNSILKLWGINEKMYKNSDYLNKKQFKQLSRRLNNNNNFVNLSNELTSKSKYLPIVLNNFKNENIKEEAVEIINNKDESNPLFWVKENISNKKRKKLDRLIKIKNIHKWYLRDDGVYRLLNLNDNNEIVDNLLDIDCIIDGPGEPSIFASYYNNDGSLGWLTIPINMDKELTKKIFSDPLFSISAEQAVEIINKKNKDNPLLKHAVNIDFSNAEFIIPASVEKLEKISKNIDNIYTILSTNNITIPRMRITNYENENTFELISDSKVKIPFPETGSINNYISNQTISYRNGELYINGNIVNAQNNTNITNPELFSGLITT